jgi:hypothetical protein
MFTRDDIRTVRSWIDPIDQADWREVEAGGRKFLLCAARMDAEIANHMVDNDPYLHTMVLLGGESSRATLVQDLLNVLPRNETIVFPAEVDIYGVWRIPGECGEECETGVCTRRLSQDQSVADINRAYSMLVDYLNS